MCPIEAFFLTPITGTQKRQTRDSGLVVREEIAFPEQLLMTAIGDDGLGLSKVFHGEDVSRTDARNFLYGKGKRLQRNVDQNAGRENQIKGGVGKQEVAGVAAEDRQSSGTSDFERLWIGFDANQFGIGEEFA